MNASLKYERLEIIENKCRYSFEKESNDIENIEKLVSEQLNSKDCPLSLDFLINTEQNEFNFFKERIQKLDIKEQILLNTLNDIKSEIKDEDAPIIQFDTNSNKKSDNNNESISNNIFNSISMMVHKILHKKKMINGKEVKECTIYDNLSEVNIEIFQNLKEENKFYEFIAIKSIMISITNLMKELIHNYLEKNKKLMMISENKEDRNFDLGKEEMNIIEANIFEDIYNDFIFKSNLCSSDLEEFFILSLNCFRKKYQMNFTLSELFTDIFWNSIFHNKELCTLYINSYLNNEIYGDIKISLKNIAKIILKVNIPLKHQIVELLGLHQLEAKEKNDLMTLIESQKKKYHWEITKSEKEKEKLNKINFIKKDEEINLNSNSIDFKNEDKNIEKKSNNMINIENNIKFNVIKANDISVIKHKKQKQAINESKPSNVNSNDNNKENVKEKQNENKEKGDSHKNDLKKNNNENDNIMDFEHKTVDEIYNYINGDKIVKNKRKKKSRKNKKAKKEENIPDENQEEIVDNIVLQFKQDLSDKLIHARYITKIKPIISEEWIKKIISSYN
jgi:hypothetical protein